jgi:predicted phosphodiesterase
MGVVHRVNLPKSHWMVFVMSDLHSFHIHKPSLSILIKHALSLPIKPSLVINGDFFDFAFLMPKNPLYKLWIDRKDGIEQFFLPEYEKEIKWGNDLLDELQMVFKDIIFIMGNHDNPRVDQFRESCPEMYKPHFDIVRSLGLEKRGIGWAFYNDWVDLGNISLTHGQAHGPSAKKKHWEKSGGRSVIFGHVHTAECSTFASRGNTTAVWSLPSMADLNPHYIKNGEVAWQNGYGTLVIKPNGNFNFHTHLIYDDELCLPDGRVIKA